MKRETDGETLTKLAHILHRRPIDANAAADLFHVSEEGYDPPNRGRQLHSCVGPLTPLPRQFWPRWLPNLIGRVVGSLTVIDLIEGAHDRRTSKRSDRGALWSCRCVCGCYEARRTASLNNVRNRMDCCFECRILRRNQNAEHYRLTGEHTCQPCGARSRSGQCPCNVARTRPE